MEVWRKQRRIRSSHQNEQSNFPLYIFSMDYPIQVFKFLEECDTLEISEAQDFLELPLLLKLTAREQYKSVQSVA